MKQIVAPVISNQEVIPNCYLMWLDSREIADEAKPGQFIMVRCCEDTVLPRPFSIHQRDGGKIALLFQIIGKGTDWLSQRNTGDKVDIFGPLGNGFTLQPETRNIMLVAGGIGIAPLYFLAQEALRKGYSIHLLYGTANANRYPEDFLPSKIKLVAATEDGSVGQKGLITELLLGYVDWADQVFACGPLLMYKSMAQMPELKGKSVQVSLEVRMGCGLGVCYGCTVKTKQGLKQICKDGPIFELSDLIW